MSITNSIFCWQLCLLQAIWFLLMRTSGSSTSVGFILISVQMGAGARGHVLLLLSSIYTCTCCDVHVYVYT